MTDEFTKASMEIYAAILCRANEAEIKETAAHTKGALLIRAIKDKSHIITADNAEATFNLAHSLINYLIDSETLDRSLRDDIRKKLGVLITAFDENEFGQWASRANSLKAKYHHRVALDNIDVCTNTPGKIFAHDVQNAITSHLGQAEEAIRKALQLEPENEEASRSLRQLETLHTQFEAADKSAEAIIQVARDQKDFSRAGVKINDPSAVPKDQRKAISFIDKILSKDTPSLPFIERLLIWNHAAQVADASNPEPVSEDQDPETLNLSFAQRHFERLNEKAGHMVRPLQP